jgi:hypothetical protein
MHRALAPLLLLVMIGCGRHGDENLGLSAHGKVTIDVAKLTEPAELVRALSLSGRDLDERLGAHRMDAASIMKLETPEQQKSSAPLSLEETFQVQSDGRGAVHVVHDNSRGNGFEATALGTEIYVKPRYGKFIKRKIEGDELARLRTSAETAAAAYLRLIAPALLVRQVGPATVAGHAGIKLTLAGRSSPDSPPAESAPGRKWRETVKVRYIDGEVVVDAKTGAALAVRLDTAYSFVRDDQPMTATLQYKQTTAAEAGAIAAPTDFTTLSRPRPMLDRQTLLEGLK